MRVRGSGFVSREMPKAGSVPKRVSENVIVAAPKSPDAISALSYLDAQNSYKTASMYGIRTGDAQDKILHYFRNPEGEVPTVLIDDVFNRLNTRNRLEPAHERPHFVGPRAIEYDSILGTPQQLNDGHLLLPVIRQEIRSNRQPKLFMVAKTPTHLLGILAILEAKVAKYYVYDSAREPLYVNGNISKGKKRSHDHAEYFIKEFTNQVYGNKKPYRGIIEHYAMPAHTDSMQHHIDILGLAQRVDVAHTIAAGAGCDIHAIMRQDMQPEHLHSSLQPVTSESLKIRYLREREQSLKQQKAKSVLALFKVMDQVD